MSSDATLRAQRLVLYEKHMERIDRVLHDFLRRAEAHCAYLVDKDGHLVTRVGRDGSIDPDTLSALVAGAFAATKEMARLLGEQEFSALFHQGREENIQLSLVADRAILTVLFDDQTTLGMVRLYVSEAVRRLSEILLDAERDEGGEGGPSLDEGYESSAKARLDDVLGDD